MRFKMGMMAGFGLGYMMGARAGRERFDEIMGTMKQLWSSPELEKARRAASELAEKAEAVARRDRTVSLDTETVEERVEPYVAAGRGADGGVLPHEQPL